ncbi:YihY/virulence factor BrkB family protein [Sphingomonas solaris]|uniref:YihY/virulence factor BrkB family protein n=1 Tax=Alterirhizorhabdus solaris TaxID=2529389 RepID=A0A558R4R1_9SPHN|nr:YihY/virulence factor BrkB family protein [Sphingomonas solaris]TVV74384.1 YihY/virulence factor BrkB family protein [Sphingomonas solaris]
MQDVSPEAPEARAQRATLRTRLDRGIERVGPGSKAFAVIKRVVVGVYSDGFIHAGNLAYLALLTLFPFFIILAALAQFFGHGPDTARAIDSFLRTVPSSVADLLRKPINDVLLARTGSLLWLGALVGLWTVGSFIETIRDILRRAYGTGYSRAFWHYRLTSAAMIIVSVILALAAFSAQVMLTAAEQFIYRLLPFAADLGGWIGIGRLAPLAILALALYILFYSLTPSKYRMSDCPKWPGAVFTALWWMSVTMALPRALGLLGGYDLTYGGLAGTIIALFFFWLVGFGLVIGAQLNAALAEPPSPGVTEPAVTA